jgi:catalase
MSPVKADDNVSLAEQALQAFDNLSGLHPGFRPAHAKGILLAGLFRPSAGARSLTRTPHIQRESTPVSVRFSNAGGIPAIPDNAPEASPRGMAIRFHLAEHVHTDIIAHSVDGFPVRTMEEFVELLRAIGASGPGVEKPLPIEKFLGAHPAALEFVQAPKPAPASFATLPFYAVSAYRFTNAEGESLYGRYRIRPEGGAQSLDDSTAAQQTPDFLFDEIKDRLAKGPVRMSISVQAAAKEDTVDDATAHWPADRPEIDFGSIELTAIVPNNDAEQRHIIFDPIPRVDGIEPSGDPLLDARATLYLMSGRRRRAQAPR